MFLKYLSEVECEPRYQPFVLRFETLASGVVLEASKRIAGLDDQAAGEFFNRVFAGALDENAGVVPPGWWLRVEPPPYKWYCDYIERELPFMIAEARRIAQVGEPGDSSESPLDLNKVRQYAHENPVLRDFIMSDPTQKQ